MVGRRPPGWMHQMKRAPRRMHLHTWASAGPPLLVLHTSWVECEREGLACIKPAAATSEARSEQREKQAKKKFRIIPGAGFASQITCRRRAPACHAMPRRPAAASTPLPATMILSTFFDSHPTRGAWPVNTGGHAGPHWHDGMKWILRCATPSARVVTISVPMKQQPTA